MYTTMTDNTKLAQFTAYLNKELDICRDMMNEFKAEFEENPAYALIWSAKTFKYAAIQDLYIETLHMLSERSIAEVQIELTQRLMNRVAHHSSSTSCTSDLFEQCKNTAMAHLIEGMDWYA
jgi:hypothetical protein